MVHSIEAFIRRSARRVGLDLHRYRPEASEGTRIARMLQCHGVDVVFDVGANVGQYASSLRSGGYLGRIVSMEPLATAWEQLARQSRRDPAWDALRIAVGTEDGVIEINVAANSVSSSILPMLDSHLEAAPESALTGIERVPMARLDSLAPTYLTPASKPFLKIDTQGYEDRVLQGAGRLLERLAGVQLELSLVPLYEGQPLFWELLVRLQDNGFDLWAIWPGFHNPRTGRMLQMDAVLFRKDGN